MRQKSASTSNPDYISLIALLRAKREDLGISQETVAEYLGIAQNQLSKWERMERRVDVLELLRYCEAIGVSLTQVLEQWEKTVKPLRR